MISISAIGVSEREAVVYGTAECLSAEQEQPSEPFLVTSTEVGSPYSL